MQQGKLAYQANCWGALGGNAVGVTSTTNLTYRTFGDMKAAFADIASAGFDGVELFDGNLLDYTAAEFSVLLDDTGLSLVAAYSGGNLIFDDILAEELDRFRVVADRLAELDAPHLVIGGGAKRFDGPREGDYPRLGAALEQVREIAEQRGLKAHYHPHLTTLAETPEQIRRVFEETEIHFCPDTAHLAAAGGTPADMLREHKARISYVHVKGLQKTPFAFMPIDRGDLDHGPIFDALRDIAFDGWLAAELDAWPNPLEGAELNMAFLKAQLELA